MKARMMWICAVSLGCMLCAGMSASAADESGFTINSPFDLTLGSTNCAVRLGKAVQSTTSATYDPETKVTTTNWSAHAVVRLSTPYHGATSVSVDFKGEERRLDSFRFDIGRTKFKFGTFGGTLSLDECRKVIVADHRHQRLIAAVVDKAEKIRRQRAAENQGSRSLAGVQPANIFLQIVVLAITRQRPAVEFLEPVGMFVHKITHHLSVHTRTNELLRRTEVIRRHMNNKFLFDKIVGQQGQLTQQTRTVDADLRAVIVFQVAADVSIEAKQLLQSLFLSRQILFYDGHLLVKFGLTVQR